MKWSHDYIDRGETCHQKIKEQQSNWHRLDRSRDDDGPLGKLTQLCNEIYNTGYWPKEPKESIGQTTTEIVMDRMKEKIEAELDDAQSGFRQGKGTREGLLNLRLICERHLEVQNDVYICFLDYGKSFDRVRHEPLMQCLSEIGVDWKIHKGH